MSLEGFISHEKAQNAQKGQKKTAKKVFFLFRWTPRFQSDDVSLLQLVAPRISGIEGGFALQGVHK